MTPGARVAAAIEILDDVRSGHAAEKTLTTWARKHRFAGSGDRAAIRDLVFGALRRRRSLAWLGGGDSGRALMIGNLRAADRDPQELFNSVGYAPPPLTAAELVAPPPLGAAPPAVRCDCPDWLWPKIVASLEEDAEPILMRLRERAPLFLRVNVARAELEIVMALLAEDGITTRPHPLSQTALEVTENPRRVQASRAYQDGLIELQDVASQAIVDRLLPLLAAGEVLDYCAGGGGKSLALAAGGAAQVVAHDLDPNRMVDIPARAARARVEITVTTTISGVFDMVFCDAPCSGSGAWRRQPEAKWRLTPEALRGLTETQDQILKSAAERVKPGGYLAYATCSILQQENADRIACFLGRSSDWQKIECHSFSPLDGGDGFYVAVLRLTAGV